MPPTDTSCAKCANALPDTHHKIAVQAQGIAFELDGDAFDPHPKLHPSTARALASFCSRACCKEALPKNLAEAGLSPHWAKNRITTGPVQPCAACSKPVILSGPHLAWVMGKVTTTMLAWDGTFEWLDIVLVLCQGCNTGMQAKQRIEERAQA